MKKIFAITLVLILALSLLVACGGEAVPANAPDGSGASETPESTPSETQEATLPSVALMNDAKIIFENMEAMLGPIYDYYEEHNLFSYTNGEPVHLAVPGPIDFSVNDGSISLERNYGWSLGELLIRHDREEKVRMVWVSMEDDDSYGGMANVYVMAKALYASCVEGITPEMGKIIADALHMGDSDFTMPEGKYERVLIYEGYNYYSYKGPSSGRYTRIWVFPASDSDWRDTSEIVFFDIDGKMIEKP